MIDQKVKKYSEKLNKFGIEHRIVEHPELKTPADVQNYLGLTLKDGLSTMVMKADSDFIAVIRRDDCRLDFGKIKKITGAENLRMATNEEFSRVTGLKPGTAQVYLPGITQTFVDPHIFEVDTLTGGSGSFLCSFRYKSEDLKKIPGCSVVDVTEVKDGHNVVSGKRIVSGITPSGDGTLHIGNYLGAVRQFIEIANPPTGGNEVFLFVADLHALTTIQDKTILERNVENLVLNELSLLMGMGGEKAMKNIVFYRQSDLGGLHPELQTILNNVTPLGLLKRAHAYKDKLAKDVMEDDINLGLFNYPILMAADILLYQADLVPVGKDQKQHVEITRDAAEKFNKIFGPHSAKTSGGKGNIFSLPEAYIPEEVATIMGTDGKRKMSKSLGNIISIFEPAETIRKQVMSCYTDPTRAHADDPGHVEGNMVFSYLDFFGKRQTVDEYKEAYVQGKVADVEIKEYLYKSLMDTFAPARKVYEELSKNPNRVKQILEQGRNKAFPIATETMRKVRVAVGLNNKYSIGSEARSELGQGRTFVTIDDFGRVEIRVGKVTKAENVAKSEKLIKLDVDVGDKGDNGDGGEKKITRTIYTGVRGFGYTPDDFQGKQFMFVTNLKPRKMPGGESQGMILAVDGPDGKPEFISADGLPVGSKVR